MTEEQLQRIQDEIMHETVEQPLELEALIKETAEKIARDIAFKNGSAKVEFDGEPFHFKAIKKIVDFKQYIYMVVVNENHQKIGKEKYRPFTVEVMIDNSFTYVENLKAAAEGFLRHITGMVQAQELPE